MITNYFASDLISQFLKILNNNKLQYVVLRNYKLLPNANDSKDVDILVAPNTFKQVIHLLKTVAKINSYQFIWKNELDYLHGFVFVKIHKGVIFSIKIDIFIGFKWRGCNYLDHNLIFKNSQTYNNFKVASKTDEAAIMIVYYILYAKTIKSKYIELIYKNAITNFDEFKSTVFLTFKKEVAECIIQLVYDNKIKTLVTLRKSIKRDVLNRNLKNASFAKNMVKHIKTEIFNRNKFGTLLAFSGPDGAGKSTLVDVLMELFYSFGITNRMEPYHFLTSNIPSIHKLPGVPKKYAKQDYTKPYQARNAGLIGSIIRITYYYFAFLLDRILYIKRELRANQIVIFDRYYIDMLTDPSRFRIGLKKEWVQKIFKTLPKPDFTLIVLADKENILSRKDELTESKLEELLEEYASLTNKIPNCQILNNNGSVEQGKMMTCKNVFTNLEIRNK